MTLFPRANPTLVSNKLVCCKIFRYWTKRKATFSLLCYCCFLPALYCVTVAFFMLFVVLLLLSSCSLLCYCCFLHALYCVTVAFFRLFIVLLLLCSCSLLCYCGFLSTAFFVLLCIFSILFALPSIINSHTK